MERIFQSWTSLASHYIGDCFDCAKPFIDNEYAKADPLVRFVAAQLFIDCHLSSESVLILVCEQKEWDADLITRAVMEGSVKFLYMMDGDAVSIKAKVNEYWELLPQFSAIKHSERAKKFIDEIPNPGAEWKPIQDLIIEDDEITAIRKIYSRQQRQALEESWSFTGICKYFTNSSNDGLRQLVHLAHGYGMSSHLLHKDADGVGMVWERYIRDSDRQNAVKLGHSSRIVSDVCAFAKLRLFSLLRAYHQSTKVIEEIDHGYAQLFEQLKNANEHFNKTEYTEVS
jgi:hypothetical protein